MGYLAKLKLFFNSIRIKCTLKFITIVQHTTTHIYLYTAHSILIAKQGPQSFMTPPPLLTVVWRLSSSWCGVKLATNTFFSSNYSSGSRAVTYENIWITHVESALKKIGLTFLSWICTAGWTLKYHQKGQKFWQKMKKNLLQK